MFDPISYLPTIIESLLGTVLGGVKGKVDNATTIELKRAEKKIEEDLAILKHQHDLERLKYTQRHELQMNLLSLLQKIDVIQLSSPEQLLAFKQLMQVTLSLATDNYVENMAPTLRNVTLNVEPPTFPPARIPNSLTSSNLSGLFTLTPPKQPGVNLQNFDFDVVTADSRGGITNTRRRQAQYLSEDVGSGIKLEMVSIPAGTFQMGSPDNEKERQANESPQHQVKVNSFLMGKFPITQAQWKAVAALSQVRIPLNADPSKFKGANRPVEQVSWYDTVEFCARLERKTGREYRLPSEAEWEYACRAGTTTPFHFGETISPEIVNYDGNYPYGAATKGKYRSETTVVGSLQAANAFGLYDMHGLVWEWCADPWHENYKNAPSDGSVWEFGGDDNLRLLRGGSWNGNARSCRAAFRVRNLPDDGSNYFGFRVVCS